ncbi:MAG: MgtC/SapB family protein [Planctomycetes bacterium]|nr:MgtC/SapB family protein [Planctomycetota bacterium]
MLTTGDFAMRLGLTFAAALVIGIERESHGRAAGLRTTMLAGLAATAAMILSEQFYAPLATTAGWHPDPARLAAGVLTGIGFLGAGTIIREGVSVRGVTTAATLWAVTVLGLTFGAGEFLLGGLLWTLLMVTLAVLPRLEHLVKNDWYAWIDLRCSLDGVDEAEIRTRLERHGLHIKRVGLTYDLVANERLMRLELKFKRAPLYELSRQVLDDLRGLDGVRELKWE